VIEVNVRRHCELTVVDCESNLQSFLSELDAMPILSPEPAHYPALLFEQLTELTESDRRWCVVHTKPRQEKSLGRTLHQAQIPYYLPLVPRHLRVRGRPTTSYIPLFDSYVFVLANSEERVSVLNTGRVVNFLNVGSQEELSGDLRRVAQLIGSGVAITPEDRIGPGTRVVVNSGPLLGLEGTIVREATRRRFFVRVNFLQKGASVLLDDYMLVMQT
jgi:transcriptional antiterminator RfaH